MQIRFLRVVLILDESAPLGSCPKPMAVQKGVSPEFMSCQLVIYIKCFIIYDTGRSLIQAEHFSCTSLLIL